MDTAPGPSPAPAGAPVPEPRRRRSRPMAASAVLVAVGLVVFAGVRLLGLERGFPLVPLLAYTPYAVLVALSAAVLTALLRRWTVTVALVLVTVALTSVVLPRALTSDPVAVEGPRVRLLTLNTHFGHTPPENVVELVRDLRVDVLALQEVTPELVEGLSEAGLDELLPHVVDHSAPAAAGGSVHAVHPLTALGDPGRDIGSLAMPRAAVEVPGHTAGLEVTSVHPMSPRRLSSMDAWSDGLRALPRASKTGPVQVLAGDFNATLDHAELRALVDSGYVDVAAHRGVGLRGTWPVDGPPLPKVVLDHVLVDSRVGFGEPLVVTVEGSTHRALFVELTLPEE